MTVCHTFFNPTPIKLWTRFENLNCCNEQKTETMYWILLIIVINCSTSTTRNATTQKCRVLNCKDFLILSTYTILTLILQNMKDHSTLTNLTVIIRKDLLDF